MTKKSRASLSAHPQNHNAKLAPSKGITKVFEFFQYTIGTTLDAALATGVLRNSITYYVRDLEDVGLLRVVYIKPDKTTGYKAKHYSSDPANWKKGGMS